MSDEKKVNTETTQAQEAAPAAPKKKHWPIVISVLAVIVIAVLVAFLHWHEQPTFCSTMCHATMDKYVSGYYSEDEGLGVTAHQQADVTCLGCHWSQAKMMDLVHEVVMFVTDEFTDPLPDQSKFVNDEFCGACHDGETASTKEQATEGWAIDPHNLPEGVAMHEGQDFACGSCHKIHKQNQMVCASCHEGQVEVPAGWGVAENEAKAATAVTFAQVDTEGNAVLDADGAPLSYDPHNPDYYMDKSAMHSEVDLSCNACHATKTLVCAECHDVFDETALPEGWTLGVNETKAATAETYGMFDPHTNKPDSPTHAAFTCDSCHAEKVIVCAQCHANSFTEVPEGWTLPETTMDLFAPAEEEPAEGEATEGAEGATTAEGVADGTYTGTGKGIGGEFEVTVTVEGGAITAVEVGENSETQGIGSKAIEQLPAAIVEANGIDGVDGVAGATITSKAIFSAVEGALSQGK